MIKCNIMNPPYVHSTNHHECQRSACVTQPGGGGAFVESWRDRGSVRVRSCQHQISPGELRPSALLLRPIYLTLFSCVRV